MVLFSIVFVIYGVVFVVVYGLFCYMIDCCDGVVV